MNKKTQTLEEALLQIKDIEDAMKQNAKGILESTMKQELKDLLREEKEQEVAEGEGSEDMSVNSLNGLSKKSKETAEPKTNGGSTKLGKLNDKVANADHANAIKGINDNPSESAEPKREGGSNKLGELADNVKDARANSLKGLSTKPKVTADPKRDMDEQEDLGNDKNLDDDGEESIANKQARDDDEDFDDNDNLGDEDFEDDDETDGNDDETDDDEDKDEEPDFDSDDEVFDMTNSPDEEVLKVFKAMKPEDGIVVKKDGGNVDVNTGEDEFIIKLDSDDDDDSDNDDMNDDDMDDEDLDEFENPEEDDAEMDSYEQPHNDINSGWVQEECEGDLEECGKMSDMDEDEETPDMADLIPDNPLQEPEGDVDEAARTKWNPHGDKGPSNRAGIKSKKLFKAGSHTMNENYDTLKKQYNLLKKQNGEYKKALGLFREKLNEVAVFNANLAYATRLFTEHSTTKQEKMNILERFDSISTMNESKQTYLTLKKELDSKQNVTETVAEKISKSPSTSTSKEMLQENKVYENEQFKRMKELMKKVNK